MKGHLNYSKFALERYFLSGNVSPLTMIWPICSAVLKVEISVLVAVIVVIVRPAIGLTLISIICTWLGVCSYGERKNQTNEQYCIIFYENVTQSSLRIKRWRLSSFLP